jgi:DNA-binding NarL/FixJ family response regulator
MNQKINIAIVEENCLFRESLRLALSQIVDFSIVLEGETVDTIVRTSAEQSIDSILLSVDAEKAHGYEALKHIRRLFPHVNILALLDYPETCYYEKAITEGANDAIPKCSTKEVIEQHVRYIMEKGPLYKKETPDTR